MALKTFRPLTPSLRFRRIVDKSKLWQGSPYKPLTVGLRKKAGRNMSGKITVRCRGGGHRKIYRIIDFNRNKDMPAKVLRIEYDPNRSAFISLIEYTDGVKSYILAPKDMKENIILNEKSGAEIGNILTLKDISIGSVIHNIELSPGKGGKIARAAGTYGLVISKKENLVLVRLKSGQTKWILNTCKATIGVVSNEDHKNIILGKAGANRWLGIRPLVRGEAKNPIDHPHGGKTRGGRVPVSPTGKITIGKKTRKKNKKI